MPIENELKESIETVTHESNQSDELTSKLVALANALVDGEVTIERRESLATRLELIFESVKVDVPEEPSEDD